MRLIPRRSLSILALAALAASGLALAVPQAAEAASAGLVVTDMTNGTSVGQLAQNLAGPGVAVSNVTYTGAPNAAGVFTGGTGILGFDSGIVLSTGSVQTDAAHPAPCTKGIEGPNQCDSNTTENGTPGDADLNAMSGFTTYDAAVLQFDFVPAGNTISFQYVFGSDEYPEYANSVYNDVFAFFVNGTNCALVPGTNLPVSVNTINGGNPLGTNPRNPQYYIDNHFDPVNGSPLNTELDGLTTVLTCTAPVVAGTTNHLKLAIADASDELLDSDVMLQSASLTSAPAPVQVSTTLSGAGRTAPVLTVPAATAVTDQATLAGSTAANAAGSVTYSLYADPACSTLVTTAGTVPVTRGAVPASTPVTLPAGTYYWQAAYTGDTTHAAGTDPCGDEILTVSPPPPPPTGSAGGPYTGPEGSVIPVTGTASDPAGNPLTTTWSIAPQPGNDPGSACAIANPAALATTVTCNDAGTWTLTLTVSDGVNAPIVATTPMTVTNVAPVVTITSPPSGTVVNVGSSTTLIATYVDPGTNDSHACAIAWADGTTTAGDVSGNTCTGSHAYSAAGAVTPVVTVTDGDGGAGSASTVLVVADGSGKVTGGGFVGSGCGQTSFGFVVQQVGNGSLKGQFEMNGRAFSFHGSTVTSLSVLQNRATWSGTGVWNNASGYTFTATAVDNGKKDTIAVTVYDSRGRTVFSTSGTLQGGNLVIH